MPGNVNENLFDASVRHAAFLQRYGGSTSKKIIGLLNKADNDMVDRIRDRLAAIEERGFDLGPATTKRLQAMLDEVRVQTRDIYKAVGQELRGDLIDLTEVEVDIAARRLTEALGVDIGILRPEPELLRAAVTVNPIRGKHLSAWVDDLSQLKVAQIRDAVNIGMTEGETTAQIIRRIRGTRANQFRDGILERGRRGADVIARTATNHVANRARNLLYEANQDVVKAVRWTSTLDNRTSPICQARDGIVYPVDQGPRPPAHPNCLPGDSLVLPGGRIAGVSKRWFDGEIIVLRTAAGRELRATPNHPVLTDRGWIGAQFLNPGSKVVCDAGGERAAALLYHGHQNVPTAIHEIAEAFLGSGDVAAVPVPTATPDFHGDGIDGEVAIVGADWRLMFGRDPALKQESGDLALERGYTQLPLVAGLCAQGLLGHADAAPADRGMSCLGEFPPFVGTGARHPGELLLTAVSERNASLFQNSFDGPWTDAEFVRDAADSSAAGVELDDVVFVERRDFSDHVYNLETENHLIIAGGILTHNCRSTISPVLRSWNELAENGALKSGRGSTNIDTLFKQRLKARGLSDDAIAGIQRNTRASMNGQVPGDISYQDWLRRQPAAFQDDILGKTKGKLFRQGELSLDKFVDDKTGRSFTLEELKRKESEAWARAGLGE